MQRGFPIPEAIANAPELFDTLALHMRCYLDVRRGLDLHGRVPWRDVQLWCNSLGLATDLTQSIQDATVQLDIVWAELHPRPKPPGKS